MKPDNSRATTPDSLFALYTWPILVAEDGEQEIRLYDDDCLDHHLLGQSRYVESRRTVAFPYSAYTADLPDGPELPEQWCRVAKEGRGPVSIAWDLYPEAMRAATKLVRLTGLVVTAPEVAGMDAPAMVW
jgi:sugar/nucleoside kinase (ribokinase family)